MKDFKVKIKIKDNQMYCGNCSRSIRSQLISTGQNQAVTQLTIYTNYTQSLVILNFKANDQTIAEQFIDAAKINIGDAGYEVKSYELATLNTQLTVPIKLENKDPTLAPKQSLAYSLPLIIAGLFLSFALKPLALLNQLSTQLRFWSYIAIGIATTVLSGHAGSNYYKNTLKALPNLSHRAMDALIALGTSAALINAYLVLSIPRYLGKSRSDAIPIFGMPLMVLGFVKFSHSIRDLLRIKLDKKILQLEKSEANLPNTARQYFNNDATIAYNLMHTETLPVSEVNSLSMISVQEGEIVPIDGTLLSDRAMIKDEYYGKKEATIKLKGEVIFAGNIVHHDSSRDENNQYVLLETICSASENHIRKAAELVNTHKQPHEKLLETVSQYFLITVSIISLLSAATWGLIDQSFFISLEVLSATLLSSCPCAFGLVDILDSLCKSLLFNEKILLQNDSALSINRYTDFVFDKGGTLTTDNYSFSHVDIGEENNADQARQTKDKYLAYAVALENKINKEDQNAIGKAILTQKIHVGTYNTKNDFSHHPDNKGRGGSLTIDDNSVSLGNKALLNKLGIDVDTQWQNKALIYNLQDKLAIFMAVDNKVCCLIVLNNMTEQEQLLRPGAIETLNWLHEQGKRIHILTGDSYDRTRLLLNHHRQIIPEITIEADKSPQEKLNTIQKLKEDNHQVVMIGDDRNDIAAMRETLGIAIHHQAKTCGKDTSMVVLNGNLLSLVQLMQLIKYYDRYTLAAIFVAFGSNITSLGMAACRLAAPTITSSLMALSSLLVGLVALFFKMHGSYIVSKVNERVARKTDEASTQFDFFKHLSCCSNNKKQDQELRAALINS